MANVYGIDFEFKAQLPPMVLETFTAAQAKLLNLKGWIESEEGTIKGHIEGENEEVKKIIEELKNSDLLKNVENLEFSEMQKIQESTIDNFEIKTSK